MMSIPRMLSIPVVLVALTPATACSQVPRDAATPSSSPSGDPVRFAACMRQHGQTVPDPDPNGDLTVAPPNGAAKDAWEGALRACRNYLPDGGQPQVPTAAELAALRDFARCMRRHGIETTDPDPTTGKSQIQGRLAGASREQVANDPGFKAAQEACQGTLPKPEPKGTR